MPTIQPYRPQPPQIPAGPLCGNPCDSRDPRRCVPPLKGLPGTRTTDVSYRALAPGGAGIGHRICTGASVSRLTAHYSLLTANSTFTFSAKEKDSETGLSYFGSRYYSSDLSIWLSVDPMAAKYASLSPYVYCAYNPVKLVDPNGEDIWIIGEDGNQYRFYQGYLYTEEGKLYIPDLDSFLSDAQDAINALRGTETGNRLISTFEGPNNKDVFIESDSKSNCDYLTTDANGEFVSQIIFWNSEGTDLMTTEGMQKSSTTDLGHEFSHVYDNVKKIKGLKDLCPNKGSRSEWRAVYKENCIREELGLPYRTGYTFKNPNGTTYFVPMLNQKGKPYMPDSFQWTPFEVCKRKAN